MNPTEEYAVMAREHFAWCVIWILLAVTFASFAIGLLNGWSVILGACAVASILVAISQAKKHAEAERRWIMRIIRNEDF